MNQGYISLTLDTLTVTFWGFEGNRYPRVRANGPVIERAASGNLALGGYAIEDPHLWEFNGKLRADDAPILRAMYNKQQLFSRRNTVYPVLVVDTTQAIEELPPRSRGLAPPPYNTVVSLPDTSLSYYAQYYAYFSDKIAITESGYTLYANVSLLETEAKVAP